MIKEIRRFYCIFCKRSFMTNIKIETIDDAYMDKACYQKALELSKK